MIKNILIFYFLFFVSLNFAENIVDSQNETQTFNNVNFKVPGSGYLINNTKIDARQILSVISNKPVFNNGETQVCVGNLTLNLTNRLRYAIDDEFSNDSYLYISSNRYNNYATHNLLPNNINVLGNFYQGENQFQAQSSLNYNTTIDYVQALVDLPIQINYGNRIAKAHQPSNESKRPFTYRHAMWCDGSISFNISGNIQSYRANENNIYYDDFLNVGSEVFINSNLYLPACAFVSIIEKDSWDNFPYSNADQFTVTGGPMHHSTFVENAGAFNITTDTINFRLVNYSQLDMQITNFTDIGNNQYNVTIKNNANPNSYVYMDAILNSISTNLTAISASQISGSDTFLKGQEHSIIIQLNDTFYEPISISFNFNSTHQSCVGMGQYINQQINIPISNYIDYIVDDIIFSIPSGEVEAGNLVNVSVRVKNIGNQNAQINSITKFNSTSSFDISEFFDTPALDAGENFTTQPITLYCLDTSQNFLYSAFADYYNQIDELNVTNNHYSTNYPCDLVVFGIDYTIDDIIIETNQWTPNLLPGDLVNISVRVKNIGNKDAENVSITRNTLNVSDFLNDTFTPPLDAGENHTYGPMEFICVNNSFTLFTAHADYFGWIDDINTSNNEDTRVIDCGLEPLHIDYIIENITFSIPGGNVGLGDIVNITTIIKNIGTKNAQSNSTTWLYSDSPINFYKNTPAIHANSSYNFTREAMCIELIDTNYTAIADIYDDIQESNETNNRKTVTYPCRLTTIDCFIDIKNISIDGENYNISNYDNIIYVKEGLIRNNSLLEINAKVDYNVNIGLNNIIVKSKIEETEIEGIDTFISSLGMDTSEFNGNPRLTLTDEIEKEFILVLEVIDPEYPVCSTNLFVRESDCEIFV